MNAPKSTQVVDKLIERLRAIGPANGYRTALARIESQRHQVDMRYDTPLPLLHVRNVANRINSVAAGGYRNESRSVQIDAYLAAGDDSRARQDALLDDIYRALHTGEKIKFDRLAIEIETGEAALDDAELGSRIVPIYLPITITYTSER